MFDTIIAGGGTAGCVLANRLSATGERVALIEAGPDFGHSQTGTWPQVLNEAFYVPTPYDWGYRINPFGYDIPFTRGKVVGGSSTVNAAGTNWGLRQDYEDWVARGASGWGFDDLEPYIQKVERLTNDDVAPSRGRSGQLFVTRSPEGSPLIDDLVKSYKDVGFPGPIDPSGPNDAEGWGTGTRNADGDVRYHAARAYLDPVRDRPNLTVIGDTLIDRLIWENGKVSGVVVIQNGERQEIRANRVVLAGGTVGTPLILQRSGIGDAETLRSLLGTDVPLHHLPGVGRNLHDHFGSTMKMKAVANFSDRLREAGFPAGQRRALFTRLKSDPALDAYDLTIGFGHGDSPLPDGTISITVFLVHLKAEGSITISSADPSAHPVINPDIGREEDLVAIEQGMRWLRNRLYNPTVSHWFEGEVTPGGTPIRDHITNNIFLFHHPTGTARMGQESDPGAVTDPSGRVHGFENLYIGDASLMPTIPRGMIIMSVYAVAEKVAAGLTGS